MLIHDGHSRLYGQFPSILKVRVASVRTRTGGTYDDNLGMSGCDLIINVLETLFELRRDALFVAEAEVLEVKGFRMSSLSTHARPF